MRRSFFRPPDPERLETAASTGLGFGCGCFGIPCGIFFLILTIQLVMGQKYYFNREEIRDPLILVGHFWVLCLLTVFCLCFRQVTLIDRRERVLISWWGFRFPLLFDFELRESRQRLEGYHSTAILEHTRRSRGRSYLSYKVLLVGERTLELMDTPAQAKASKEAKRVADFLGIVDSSGLADAAHHVS